MGGAASKQVATKAASAAAKASASAASTAQSTATAGASAASSPTAPAAQQAQRVVQTKLSPQEVVGAASAAKARRAADMVRNPKAQSPQIGLMEMNQDLLKEMDTFQDFERVAYLKQDTDGFQRTASSYRVRSSEPVPLPKDRTVNAMNVGEYDKMDGRLTNRDMRFLLRLHYEDPVAWDYDTLGAHFGVDPKRLENILAYVGPPNVLKPLGPMEHPLGIWYDSPQAAAAMVPEFTEPEALPATSSPSSSGNQSNLPQ